MFGYCRIHEETRAARKAKNSTAYAGEVCHFRDRQKSGKGSDREDEEKKE